MVESKEDLSLPGLDIESSLMWRSKPSLLRTWLQRWKRGGYIRPLFGRILKPCRWSAFEAELTSSLAVIPANHFRQQANEKEKTIPDTSGLTFSTSSRQLSLFDVSLKTSKDTLASDCERSLATWKALVIKRRLEYSQRVKSAHRIRESGFLSWPTPCARDHKDTGRNTNYEKLAKKGKLSGAVMMYPTPSAHEARLGYQDRSDPTKKGTQESLTTVVVNKAGGRSKCPGHLNPNWVEGLMGLSLGSTALGSSEFQE
jgi:hypothetical protein